MRKILLSWSALAGLALVATAADAADLGTYFPAYEEPAPTAEKMRDRFCDAYAGVQAGYLWGDADYSGPGGQGVDTYLADGKNDGVSGGLYAGCNWNSSGPILWGIEGDINLTGAGLGDDNWYGTLRLRAGPTNGQTLFFLTGGLAFGQIDMVTPPDSMQAFTDWDTPVAFGWTAGFGVEHWFSPRVSWKTEYLYIDLGKIGSVLSGGFEQLSVDWTGHAVRTGIAVHY